MLNPTFTKTASILSIFLVSFQTIDLHAQAKAKRRVPLDSVKADAALRKYDEALKLLDRFYREAYDEAAKKTSDADKRRADKYSQEKKKYKEVLLTELGVALREETMAAKLAVALKVEAEVKKYEMESTKAPDIVNVANDVKTIRLEAEIVALKKELTRLKLAAKQPTGRDADSDFPPGKPVDLLPLINDAGVVTGHWQRTKEGLRCDASPFGRLEIPVDIQGSYVLHFAFTRGPGKDKVNFIGLPVGGEHATFVFNSRIEGGACANGIQKLDGKLIEDHPTHVKKNIPEGFRFFVEFHVSLPKKDTAEVIVYVTQGKPRPANASNAPFFSWSGSLSSLKDVDRRYEGQAKSRVVVGSNMTMLIVHDCFIVLDKGSTANILEE